jgi:hypothetical protein
MEADWEIEVGGDALVIEAQWEGFVDLRRFPDRVGVLPEAQDLQGLTEVLIRLNAPESRVWTSKCDVWTISEFDPLEFDAPPDVPLQAFACYLDVLPGNEGQGWGSPDAAISLCREICDRLRAISIRCCRVDLVVRRALIAGQGALGTTAYVSACGASLSDAKAVLEQALRVFAEVVSSYDPEGLSSQITMKERASSSIG